ncbi:MAG TPA: Na-translocating system protein MpsC family protein, partial [Thermoanaerobaculia bacterium]|nr:Na-translocating system protein MpsC family protein [Thermoanaerobaculia bacterium]
MEMVDEEPEGLTGGELNAAVTREVVRIHTASLGRGPRKSFSFYNGNVIVSVLHEGLSRAERTLVDAGDAEAVRAMR